MTTATSVLSCLLMPSYLLVAPRPGVDVTQAELADFTRALNLTVPEYGPIDLDHHVIDSESATLPDLSAYDGVLVGGSPFNVTDLVHTATQKHVQSLMVQILQSAVPSLFICFGSGFCTWTMGGRVDRSYGESASVSTVELTEAATDDPICRYLPQRFQVLTGHVESVAEIADSAVVLGTGPTCPVQFYRVNRNTWATQFHPELDATGFARRMAFYSDHGYYDTAKAESIIESANAAELSPVAGIFTGFRRFCEVDYAGR